MGATVMPLYSYQARCDCGWSGIETGYEQTAISDADYHEVEMHPVSS